MQRTYSIVVFGATGFTGKYVLQELLSSNADRELGLPIAAAGRNAEKVADVLKQLNAQDRVKVMGNINVDDQDSLSRMCSSSRLVLNVVGPYRKYGEPVVKACVEAGTHYLDVSGEPEFIERVEAKYREAARQAGCYIASASGYDSVPGDVGTVIAQREFSAPALPSSVEAYLQICPGPAGYKVHYATYESAVLGVASVDNLRKLRSEVKRAGRAPATNPLGPRPKPPTGIEWIEHPAVQAFSVPFPGADASVVKRTQAALEAGGEPSVHFTARFVLASRYHTYLTALTGTMLGLLAKTSWGRSMLLSHPGFFSAGVISHEGPTEEQMASTTSVTTLVARGYSTKPQAAPGGKVPPPDREVVLRITGPDPAYKATAIFLAQAGISLLLDKDKLPAAGVQTVGALLRNTRYVDRLKLRGIKIEKLSDGPVAK
mmetsp:Transcript_30433/g.67516  ORF Transcript_30433/g.67516 Transcript_30433/m.67516 type:complete len:431 (-) Transcript_30433:552-1844(-)